MCPVPFRVQIGWLHGQSVSYLSRAVEDFQDAIADQALVVARFAATAFQFDPAIAGRTIRTGHIALLHMKSMRQAAAGVKNSIRTLRKFNLGHWEIRTLPFRGINPKYVGTGWGNFRASCEQN
jgi:hypothetical protein